MATAKPKVKETKLTLRVISVNPAPFIKKTWNKTKPFREHGLMFLISMGLVAAAQATIIWAPRVGVYVNAAALVGLVAIAMAKPLFRKVGISLAIIPVANMIAGSFLPSGALGNVVVYDDALLLLAVIYRFMFTLDHPLQASKLTWKGYAMAIPLMMVLGQALGVIGYLFLRHHYEFLGYPLPLVAAIAVVLAFAEEMLMRGLIQQQASVIFHPLVAAFGTAVLYTLLALDHGTMLTVPVAILLGAVLSFTYYKKQNLILTATINATAKLTYIGLVAGFVLR